MSTAPRHPGSHPHEPAAGKPSGEHDTGPCGASSSHTAAAPLIDDRKQDAGSRRGLNAARLEVRIRRIALAGLVAVPLVYFVAQSLR